MGQLVELDDHRPHLTMACDAGHVHVLPVALVLDIAHADQPIDHLPDCLYRKILGEWLVCLREGYVELAQGDFLHGA